MKKLVCVILIFSLLLTMSSCSFFDRFNSDLGDISFDEDRNLVYHGNTYYKTDLGFYVDYAEGDDPFELGWSSQFPFFPDVHYYAFDEDTPLYIYHANSPSKCGFYFRRYGCNNFPFLFLDQSRGTPCRNGQQVLQPIPPVLAGRSPGIC